MTSAAIKAAAMELDVLDTPTPTPPLVSPVEGAGVGSGAMGTLKATAHGFLVGEPGSGGGAPGGLGDSR